MITSVENGRHALIRGGRLPGSDERRARFTAIGARVPWALMCGALAIAYVAVAQASDSGGTSADTSKPGCWSDGNWYAEGHVLKPDPRRRIAVPGAFVCRGGRWVFDPSLR